jgi:hypothetical protein
MERELCTYHHHATKEQEIDIVSYVYHESCAEAVYGDFRFFIHSVYHLPSHVDHWASG